MDPKILLVSRFSVPGCSFGAMCDDVFASIVLVGVNVDIFERLASLFVYN
jgi:hypothetical protein